MLEFYIDNSDCPLSDFSINSLKTLLVFIFSISDNLNPLSIIFDENNLFQLEWKKDRVAFLVKFKSIDNVEYKISQYIGSSIKPDILTGTMKLFNFVKYLKTLD